MLKKLEIFDSFSTKQGRMNTAQDAPSMRFFPSSKITRDRRTDGLTDGPTDTTSYRNATAHLKKQPQNENNHETKTSAAEKEVFSLCACQTVPPVSFFHLGNVFFGSIKLLEKRMFRSTAHYRRTQRREDGCLGLARFFTAAMADTDCCAGYTGARTPNGCGLPSQDRTL